jgi:SpoU rRNA methylase family enzyme
VCVNNISSPQRLIDTAKVMLSYTGEELKALVVTKASGLAAQAGLSEASRMLYRVGKPLIILPSLKDALELLKPDRTFIYWPGEMNNYLGSLTISGSERVMLVFSGQDDGPSRSEIALGQPFNFEGFTNYLPPPAALSLSLKELRELIKQ